jgi:hypothetical protein
MKDVGDIFILHPSSLLFASVLLPSAAPPATGAAVAAR